jgi:hypothetical protein
MAQRWTWGFGGDLRVDPLKSHRGLCIIGLDAGPCIIELVVFCITCTVFKLWILRDLCTLIWFKNLCNNSLIQAMYVIYYTSLLRWWQPVMILIMTNHPCLRAGCHNRVMRQRTIIFYKVPCSPHMGRKATWEITEFLHSICLDMLPSQSQCIMGDRRVSSFLFLNSLSFHNLGTRFLLRGGGGL